MVWTRSSARLERRTLNRGDFAEKSLDWGSFRKYFLRNHSQRHVKDTVNYAKKYFHCLANEDFSELTTLSASKRRHVMAALSNLSKFLGKYEDFRRLVKSYGLKWESVKVEDLLISRMTKVKEYGEVLKWIRDVKARFPEFSSFVDFILASGLRLVEAVASYNLIIDLAEEGKLDNYYNAETEALEHFRFKQLFIRNNKKAFVSFVPKQVIERICREKKLTVCILYNHIKRNGYRPRFNEIRELFATHMTRFLSPAEIDFLQGRVSGSVFMRNYFNPALIGDLRTRVFKGIASLKVC